MVYLRIIYMKHTRLATERWTEAQALMKLWTSQAFGVGWCGGYVDRTNKGISFKPTFNLTMEQMLTLSQLADKVVVIRRSGYTRGMIRNYEGVTLRFRFHTKVKILPRM